MRVIFFLIAIPLLISFAIAGVSAAPWVPTKPTQKRRLIDQLQLQPGMKIYDLGSGTGTLLFAAHKKEPGVQAVGFEISLFPYIIAKLHELFARTKGAVTTKFRNLFKQDLSDADLIFVFLLNKCYPRLQAKFAKELKPECIVVVEAWPLHGIQAYKVIREKGLLPVYLYKGKNLAA